jgi:polysaccharide deacetylase family protein (PEP-CTERM system associated)
MSKESEARTNIMTVDVEDWFHILDVEGGHTRQDWPRLESRVERNTDRILELLHRFGCKATFFVVGWIAERHPALLRRIAAGGHELGSHSYWHQTLQHYDRRSLREDLDASRKAIEDAAGTRILGFRAAGNSITHDTAWAFDTIAEAGFSYDASICPGYSSHGGFESPFAGPHRIRCASGELVEIPSSTLGLAGRRFPYAGGGYFRLLPYPLIQLGIAAENRRGWPANVYIHPREIDPGQPRMKLPALRRFKYYVGLSRTQRKLEALLRAHRWVSVQAWIGANESRLADRILDVRAIRGSTGANAAA